MNTIARFFSFLSINIFLLVASECNATRNYISPGVVIQLCQEVYQQVRQDNFTPDLIIGLSRGGLVPLGFLAGEEMFDLQNVFCLSVKSYSGTERGDINLLLPFHADDIKRFTSILVVDDIVDSGRTIEFVQGLLQQALPSATIRTASLFYKPKRSSIKPDYYAAETDEWIVFPWEK